MKKTSEALSDAQNQAEVRRHLLESGKIRLIPEKRKPPAPQEEDEMEEAREQASR